MKEPVAGWWGGGEARRETRGGLKKLMEGEEQPGHLAQILVETCEMQG